MSSEERKQNNAQKLIIILGTTAVGKTKLSVELAQELSKYLCPTDKQNNINDIIEHQVEVISADSVQVYKGMEICSDAITPGLIAFVFGKFYSNYKIFAYKKHLKTQH